MISNFDFFYHNKFKIPFRIQTELWDMVTSTTTVITPSLPDANYKSGASFLLGPNECRKSGKLPWFKSNWPQNLKIQSKNQFQRFDTVNSGVPIFRLFESSRNTSYTANISRLSAFRKVMSFFSKSSRLKFNAWEVRKQNTRTW